MTQLYIKAANDHTSSQHNSSRTNGAIQARPALPVRFVLLRRYCELTGESVQAVHDRRRRGDWQDGIHCTVVDGRRLWVNLAEVEKWIQQRGR